jgi:hypothetical protein
VSPRNFQFDHFSFYLLTEGVYAATGSPNGGSYSNAGVIDLGNETLIFDTFMTPIAAIEMMPGLRHSYLQG